MKGKVYEYAVIRIVPCVVKQEFINVAVIMYSRHLRFLDIKVVLQPHKLQALQPDIDMELIQSYVDSFEAICRGVGTDVNGISTMEPHERFRWLTANRSTIIQSSAIHTGITTDAQQTLDQLVELYLH